MNETRIALFSLLTVLFHGGLLRLRIFEPRYLTMVGRCMRENAGFGAALILAGREAGAPARTVSIGTLARIADFEQLDDGLLGITARGERRFGILSVTRQSDGLYVADVQWLEQEASTSVPEQYEILAQLLQRVYEQAGAACADEPRYDDATWVSLRLAEILPLSYVDRQELLEMSDVRERLKRLRARLDLTTLSMD